MATVRNQADVVVGRATSELARTRTATGVAAVVVTHGADPDLPATIAAIAPQVDELVVVANLPGTTPPLPEGTVLIENDRPAGFATNVNRGVAATTTPYVAVVNPDAVAEPDAVRTLLDFAQAHPRCGIAGPQLRFPDGRWQASRRRFPTVWGTFVRRTPLRLFLKPLERQSSHYLFDEQPTEPTSADWMLGAFLLIRRDMLDEIGGMDEAFRLYGEDIEIAYRAAKRGWERWYVPDAVVHHRMPAVIDHRFFTRRTWWHLKGMVHFLRLHPERLLSLR